MFDFLFDCTIFIFLGHLQSTLVAKPMVKNITREQTICIFFCQDYTKSNVKNF